MNLYEHFATHTVLPIRLNMVREHILETGFVNKIVRYPVDLDHYIMQGGYQLYRDLTSYAHGEVARIGYPKNASEGLQRLVTVKEMLHILDPHEATSPTKEAVDKLIKDLIVEGIGKKMGLPAHFDKNGLLHALCILVPRDWLDIVRPAYREDKTLDEIADEARITKPFAQIAMTDEWRDVIEKII